MDRARKTQTATTDRWISLRKAARALGISEPTVMTRALRGELETQIVDGRVFVARESVERHCQTA